MILTRSPYYLRQLLSSQFVKQVSFGLEVNKRTVDDVELVDEFEIVKNRPSDTAEYLWADISSLVSPFYEHTPFSLSDLQGGPNILSRENEFFRITTTVTQSDSLGTNFSTGTSSFFTGDGYTKYLEGANFQPSKQLMLSHNNYKMDARGYFVLPIQVITGSETFTINSSNVSFSAVSSPLDRFQYFIINGADYTTDIAVNFNGETINIERVTECKYPVKEVQFINRYGMVESIHFYKNKKDTFQTQKEEFQNAYYDGVSYNPLVHQKKQYNKTLNQTFRMETGFLNEDYNTTIQELMASEKVWLRESDVITPVNITSSSLELKTGITDKVISYSLEFEHAFDEINNV